MTDNYVRNRFTGQMDNLGDPNDPRLSDDRVASGIRTATGVVSGASATAPLPGQTPVATSSTTFEWSGSSTAGIDQTVLAGGTVGIAYTQRITATGGTAPYTFAAVGLPAGLAINASTGVISGTPTARSNSTVAVSVTDSTGARYTRGLSLSIGRYSDKIQAMFGAALIGYWQQSEPSGTTCIDSSPALGSGTYSNVTLAQAGIGDGQTAALYTASPLSNASIYSAGMAAAFNPAEFTMGLWFKVDSDTVWTDGNIQTAMKFGDTAGTQAISIHKNAGGTANNGSLTFHLAGASGGSLLPITGITTGVWHHLVITFSNSANSVVAYLDGRHINNSTIGSALLNVSLGTACRLGGPSSGTTWVGSLAHCFLLNRAVTAYEVSQLYRLYPGVWKSLGTVIESVGENTFYKGEPNLLYDTDPVLLTGNEHVFKLWQTASTTGNPSGIRSVGYAESLDAVNWTNYPGVLISGFYRPFVVKNNGYYWMAGGNLTTGAIDLYRSIDGIAWTIHCANVAVDGATGAWDNLISGNACLYFEGSSMYLYYEAAHGAIYTQGLTVSTDGGHTWTPYANNPVQATAFGSLIHIPTLAIIYKSSSGKYYAWNSVDIEGLILTAIVRYESDSIYGPWTQSGKSLTIEPYCEANGLPAISGSIGQLSDFTMCEANGKMYAMMSALPNQLALHYEVFSADMSTEQLVSTLEGVLDISQGNWLPNASFESEDTTVSTNTCYWTNTADDGAISRTTIPSEVHADSSRTVAVKLTAGTNVDTKISHTIAGLIPGRVYTLSGWARGDGVNAGRLRVQNTSAADLVTWPTTLSVGVTYAEFVTTFTSPLNGQAVISCYCPATVHGVAYFDDLSLRLV